MYLYILIFRHNLYVMEKIINIIFDWIYFEHIFFVTKSLNQFKKVNSTYIWLFFKPQHDFYNMEALAMHIQFALLSMWPIFHIGFDSSSTFVNVKNSHYLILLHLFHLPPIPLHYVLCSFARPLKWYFLTVYIFQYKRHWKNFFLKISTENEVFCVYLILTNMVNPSVSSISDCKKTWQVFEVLPQTLHTCIKYVNVELKNSLHYIAIQLC